MARVVHVLPVCGFESHSSGRHLCEQMHGPVKFPCSFHTAVVECASVGIAALEIVLVDNFDSMGAVQTKVLVQTLYPLSLNFTSLRPDMAVLSQMSSAMPPYGHIGIKISLLIFFL